VSPEILVVDDEPLIRWSLKERLTAAGYGVVEAETGLEAVDVFAARLPALVLLDLALPELDGLGVLRSVRRLDPACAVIVMSAQDSPSSGSGAEALRLGAAHFLAKPFDVDAIVALVEATLARAGSRLE
jgi:two-component system chemotaxis response regulator CheY